MSEEQNRALTDKFMLRLPDGMRDRVKSAAASNNRSMNAEIISVLQDRYSTEVSPASEADIADVISKQIETNPLLAHDLLRLMRGILDGLERSNIEGNS